MNTNANSKNTIDSRIPTSIADDTFVRQFTSALESENTREFVKKIMSEEINNIKEKVDCSYSSNNYEEFQGAVIKIALMTISNDDGRKKIKELAKEAAKEFIEDQGWKQKQFWIPILISVITAVVAIYIDIK